MYGNDYSWVPGFFGGGMALAAVGGFLLAFIRPERTGARMLWAWLSLPILLSTGVGIVAALYGENLEPSTPILIVTLSSMILLPPWLIAAVPAFVLSRFLQ